MDTQQTTINIVDEIVNDGSYEHCVILTFNNSLSFYENIILRKLWYSGCYNNVILMDGRQHDELIGEEAEGVQFCGKYYSLDPIRSKGAFHPKIVLLTNKNGGKLLIGSGNVTVPGYSNNYELFYKFKYNKDKTKYLEVFVKVVEFIKSLAKQNYLNPSAQKRINLMLSDTDWLSGNYGKADETFLHNLDMALFDQIVQKVPNDVNEIVLMAPYFDNKIIAVSKIQKKYPNAQIKIIIQNNNSNFPLKYFMDNKTDYPNITLHKFKSKESGRRLHAKMLYFSNNKYEYLFSGSPNISKPALIEVADKGNVECGIFIKSEKGKDQNLSNIWKNNLDENKIDDVEGINVWEPSTGFKKSVCENNIYIKGAYIKDFVLYIDYESKIVGTAEIVINGYVVEKDKMVFGESRFEQIMNLNINKYLSRNANTICVRCEGKESNIVWLHNFTITKPGKENKITKHFNSLGSYIVNIERLKAIIELTTSSEINHGVEKDLFKNNKLGEQEENGEQVELPEQYFFVEEKSEYQDVPESLKKIISNNQHDDFGDFLAGLGNIISNYKKITASNKKPITGNGSSKKINIVEQLSITDVENKFLSLINRKINRMMAYINKDDTRLILPDIIAINQLVASMTWFLNGIKINVDDDCVCVFIDKHEYINNVITLLHRVWVNIKEDDYLYKDIAKDHDKLLSLMNIITLPLCLIPYCMWLIKHDDKHFESIESDFDKLAEIFLAIHNIINKMPNTVSKEKIINVYNRILNFSNGFVLSDLCWHELFNEKIDEEELKKELKAFVIKYKIDLQSRKKIELNKINEEINLSLSNKNKQTNASVFTVCMEINKIDNLEKRKEEVEKIIAWNIKLDKNINDYQLPPNVKKFFSL